MTDLVAADRVFYSLVVLTFFRRYRSVAAANPLGRAGRAAGTLPQRF
ncbi:hypothetical protein ABNQ38_21760 [Azospirillum sp. A29]